MYERGARFKLSMRLQAVAIVLMLTGCATEKIKKAYDEGYAKAMWEKEMMVSQQMEALEGGNKSLRLSLVQCYKRLERCQGGEK